mmetsp:Transcript_73000/g.142837  ORF Transcript_73000/g.142837 Transcript_73000/m.142837 type:complete len:361 (-) Transcript_73000:15-1097(-)
MVFPVPGGPYSSRWRYGTWLRFAFRVATASCCTRSSRGPGSTTWLKCAVTSSALRFRASRASDSFPASSAPAAAAPKSFPRPQPTSAFTRVAHVRGPAANAKSQSTNRSKSHTRSKGARSSPARSPRAARLVSRTSLGLPSLASSSCRTSVAPSRAKNPPATTSKTLPSKVANWRGFPSKAVNPDPRCENTVVMASSVRRRSSSPLAAICRKLTSSLSRSASAFALASALTRSSSALRRSASSTWSCSSCFSLSKSSVALRCSSLRRLTSSRSLDTSLLRSRSRESSAANRCSWSLASKSTVARSVSACLSRSRRSSRSLASAAKASARTLAARAWALAAASTCCASTSPSMRPSRVDSE